MLAEGYFLKTPAQPLVRADLPVDDPGPGEALVAVEACGLCHTDLAFADGSVAPRHSLPLVLGHEITGTVVAAGAGFAHLVGEPVLVPAVLPCGSCAFCRAGRGNACPRQKMPGNDIHGGFSSHLLVPAAPLVSLAGAPPGLRLDELSVVADAVSTAYQAALRAELAAGDLAVVVGAGGVGGFLVQIARALGARVVACDVSADALRTAAGFGAERTIDVTGREAKEVRQEVRGMAKGWEIQSLRLRIFEASGTPQGQTLAFALLDRAATLVQVGYTPESIPLRLSNLMAFDATVHGTWGCPPEAYPGVLELIYGGQVTVSPVVDHAPMSDVNRLLDDMAGHRLARRMILHPGS
ncbi:MAG TPA: 6-hydroxycyclohex-1-ene-1-carbonyl-CoA dehydrogenase [Thermoanaerobaculia bacterium]